MKLKLIYNIVFFCIWAALFVLNITNTNVDTTLGFIAVLGMQHSWNNLP